MDSGKPQLYVFLTILYLRVVSACLDGKFHFHKSFGSCVFFFLSAFAFFSEISRDLYNEFLCHNFKPELAAKVSYLFQLHRLPE